MFCPSCGQAAQPGHKFCSVCGTPLVVAPPIPPSMPGKYCRGCHTQADANRVYCSHCGRLLMLQDAYGMELLRIRDLGIFANPAAPLAMRTGFLIIRDDQIIFDQPKAPAMRKLLDKKTSIAPCDDGQWLMEDIRSAEKGRQCGVRPALILTLKDGRSLRFSGNGLTAELLRQALQIIEISIK